MRSSLKKLEREKREKREREFSSSFVKFFSLLKSTLLLFIFFSFRLLFLGGRARAFFFYLSTEGVTSFSSSPSLESQREDDSAALCEAEKRTSLLFRSNRMATIRCLHHRSLPALFLLLLVFFLSVLTAKKQERNSIDDADLAGSALIDWIRASGGHSDVHVGLVVDAPAGAEPTSTKKTKKKRRRRGKKESSSSALRGTIATRDIAAGEAIIRLPSNISVPLGGTGVTSPVR